MNHTHRLPILLILLSVFANCFASQPRDLLAQAREYHPANIRNGCFVESAIFCDWFMSQDSKAWATPVLGVKGVIAGQEFNHALALFEVKDRLYIWDITYGVIPLTTSRKEMLKAGSLQAVAEKAYRSFLSSLEMKASETGQVLTPISNIPIAGAPLDFVAERISLTRPVMKLSVQTSRGAVPAMAFVYNDRLFVFDEVNGTTGGVFGSDPLGYLKSIIRNVYGSEAGVKILQQIAPRT